MQTLYIASVDLAVRFSNSRSFDTIRLRLSLSRTRRRRGIRAGSPLHPEPGQAQTTALVRRAARSLSTLALLAFAGRVSDNDCPRFYILHRNCSRTNNCSLANCDARTHERIRTNPRVGANHNGRAQQRKIRLGMIVCSGAKMRAVRDRNARPERHTPKIINKYLLADGAFISSLEIPWEINRRRRIDMHASANLCAETPKQESSPTKTRPWTKPKKRQHECPKHTATHLTCRVLLRSAILRNVQHAITRGQTLSLSQA